MEGKLEKLTIKAYKKPDYSDGPVEFAVMFNPASYNMSYTIEYQAPKAHGATGSNQVYTHVKSQEYSFEFIFDGTGASADKKDVNQLIDDFLNVTAKYDGEIHRPKYLKIIWGTFKADCVLKSADINYNLFNPDGSPLRAKITAKFAQHIEDVIRTRQEDAHSPDLTHMRTIISGDTIPITTYKFYGDISYYLQVAKVNKLNSFRSLKPGTRLYFPPIT